MTIEEMKVGIKAEYNREGIKQQYEELCDVLGKYRKVCIHIFYPNK